MTDVTSLYPSPRAAPGFLADERFRTAVHEATEEWAGAWMAYRRRPTKKGRHAVDLANRRFVATFNLLEDDVPAYRASASVTRLRLRAQQPTNDPRQEFLFAACIGQPPARQKMLLLMARDPAVGLIDDATAEIMINALGIEAA